MDNWKIPLFKMYWDENDVTSISNTIKRGDQWSSGPEIDTFENLLSSYIDSEYCLSFNSGTSALHAILAAFDIKNGDEVIVPSFTFIATANAPIFVGARPIFADIEETTFGLDPDSVKKNITDRTKAIIAVHFAGCPCMIIELKKIAEENGLILIEDAAESLGASVGRKKVGSFGDAAILSFCQNKIIATGEGGAVVTRSEHIYNKLRLFRSHGRADTTNFFSTIQSPDYISLGYNFRMSSILASLGISQLSKIDRLIDLRVNKSDIIKQKLSQIADITIPQVPQEYTHVYQMFPIIINQGKKTRGKLQKYLAEKGIMTKVYFDPVHLTRFYRDTFGCHVGELPITEKVSDCILVIPLYPSISEVEIKYMTESIAAFFNLLTS
jgi:perosamine synthetase